MAGIQSPNGRFIIVFISTKNLPIIKGRKWKSTIYRWCSQLETSICNAWSHIFPYFPICSHIFPYVPIFSHIFPYFPNKIMTFFMGIVQPQPWQRLVFSRPVAVASGTAATGPSRPSDCGSCWWDRPPAERHPAWGPWGPCHSRRRPWP